jgi:DNA repair exonuclease SbcCD ATPase subunit
MSFRRRTTETIADLQRQVATLSATVTEQSQAAAAAAATADAPAEPPLAPPSPGTSLTEVQDMVRRLADRVDGLDARQLQDHERLSLRLEELTTQFSNQLVEMGHELDGGHQQVASQLAAQEQRLEELAAATANGSSADGQNGTAELVEELRANQVRIANDLARHEIAFRQDLAALAELVSRTRRGS